MSIVVVLSTYNGKRWLKEQLDSLRCQTRKPDFVVIGDDCSTDSTPELVERYIADYNLENWILIKNSENKGWKKNFHDLILSRTEDIIFLCDQDDIWMPNKIEEMAGILEQRSEIDLLACGYTPLYLDDTRRISKKITKELDNTGEVKKVSMDEKFMNVLRPGCTFAVRGAFCQQISSEWSESLPHDAMLWRCAVVKGTGYLYKKNLITWRRYNTSGSNPNRQAHKYNNKYSMLLEFYIGNNESHLEFLGCLNKLINNGSICVDKRKMDILEKSEEFEKAQKKALSSKRCFDVIYVDVKYRKFLMDYRVILSNLYVTLKAKK